MGGCHFHSRSLYPMLLLFKKKKKSHCCQRHPLVNIRRSSNSWQGNSTTTFLFNLTVSRSWQTVRMGFCTGWTGYKRVCITFQDECHNFIKVLLKKNDDTLFVCGTNAFNPSCRNYKVNAVLSVGSTRGQRYSMIYCDCPRSNLRGVIQHHRGSSHSLDLMDCSTWVILSRLLSFLFVQDWLTHVKEPTQQS